MRICCVGGARPNFVKLAAVLRAMEPHPALEPVLVHTGQHYDANLSQRFFDDLDITPPAANLEVGSAAVVPQTAEIMRRFDAWLGEQAAAVGGGDAGIDLVLVVGDVNSTVAAALTARQRHIPVAHVEAGLRSGDRRMPEEINRIVTDAISDLLFASEPAAVVNLRAEGVPKDHVFFVGNVMIDSLLRMRERAEASDVLRTLALSSGGYGLLTLHRPENVDDAATTAGIIDLLANVAADVPIVWPLHPRARARLTASGLLARAEAAAGLTIVEPLGYLDSLKLLAHARLVLTDSGGIQEEATILEVPCLTMRETTERPATIESGMNRLVGIDPARVTAGVQAVLGSEKPACTRPEKWDGKAAEHIVDILLRCERDGIPTR